MEGRPEYADTGPIAAPPPDSADPGRDSEFWAWLTGWAPVAGGDPHVLRHPSGRGPLLELCDELAPKGEGKNRMHLDLRLEAGDDADALARGIGERGGSEVQHPEWGELPWRFFVDPSGNEFCVLASRG